MLRKLFAVAVLCLASLGAAHAQSTSPVILPGGCGTGSAPQSLAYLTVDSTLKLCVNATVSASISPFTPGTSGARGTQLAVTTSDSSGSLPTNAGAVVVTNTGSNPMFCNVNGNVATTSDQEISASGGWFNFGIPSGQTALHCIATGGSTTANSLGGSGLATGTGGGGGGSGGGGAVFGPTAVGSANANPPVVIGGTVTGAAGQNVQGLAIKPASTAAAATDLSAVTNESPNSQLSTAIGTTADAPCTLPATTTACSDTAIQKAMANAVLTAPTLGSATGGLSVKTLAALSNTAIAVKASAGQVYKVQCYNPDASAKAYIQIFNVAAASVTMGTTAPTEFFGIAAGTNAGFAFSLVGEQYSTAISAGAATTATGGTAPTTALDCTVTFN